MVILMGESSLLYLYIKMAEACWRVSYGNEYMVLLPIMGRRAEQTTKSACVNFLAYSSYIIANPSANV